MKKVISLSIYAPGDIDQLLATAALEKTPDDYFTSNQAAYMAKRDYVISRISTMNASVNAKLQTHDINYLTVSNPQAGQYQVLSLPFFLGKTTPEGLQITDDITLGKYLLSKGLGLLPGSLFGLSKKEMKFRLTFASSDEELQKGLDRLEQVMQSFRN